MPRPQTRKSDIESRFTVGLTATDRATLDRVGATYKAKLGFPISNSLLIAVALNLLDEQVSRGKLVLLPDSNAGEP